MNTNYDREVNTNELPSSDMTPESLFSKRVPVPIWHPLIYFCLDGKGDEVRGVGCYGEGMA